MSVLPRISRKRVNPFDRTARNGRGHCFCLCSPFRPLTSPFSSSANPCPGRPVRLGLEGGKAKAAESIMELFKFVSNIEISFMPGELIIEVYRRTRRGLRMPGIVRTGGRRGGEVNFLFFARLLFPIAPAHQNSSLSLSRLFISPRGNEDVSFASRRRLPFNFARSPRAEPSSCALRGNGPRIGGKPSP